MYSVQLKSGQRFTEASLTRSPAGRLRVEHRQSGMYMQFRSSSCPQPNLSIEVSLNFPQLPHSMHKIDLQTLQGIKPQNRTLEMWASRHSSLVSRCLCHLRKELSCLKPPCSLHPSPQPPLHPHRQRNRSLRSLLQWPAASKPTPAPTKPSEQPAATKYPQSGVPRKPSAPRSLRSSDKKTFATSLPVSRSPYSLAPSIPTMPPSCSTPPRLRSLQCASNPRPPSPAPHDSEFESAGVPPPPLQNLQLSTKCLHEIRS